MDRIAARFFGDPDYLFAIEVGRRACPREPASLVGLSRMQRRRVVIRKNGDGADAHFGGRADDANRNLAAVGDQKTVRSHISLVSFEYAGSFA